MTQYLTALAVILIIGIPVALMVRAFIRAVNRSWQVGSLAEVSTPPYALRVPPEAATEDMKSSGGTSVAIQRNPHWTENRRGWFRLSVLGVVVWFGVVLVMEQSSRTFRWFDYRGDPSDASWFFLSGAAVILLVFNLVPWILKGFRSDT
jgi:hypothetical protein